MSIRLQNLHTKKLKSFIPNFLFFPQTCFSYISVNGKILLAALQAKIFTVVYPLSHFLQMQSAHLSDHVWTLDCCLSCSPGHAAPCCLFATLQRAVTFTPKSDHDTSLPGDSLQPPSQSHSASNSRL